MEAHKKDIAVVILNWNGQKWLEKFLPTVIEKSSMANIYIADNASTDNSVNFIEYNFPTCLLYTSPSPRDVEESRMPSSA